METLCSCLTNLTLVNGRTTTTYQHFFQSLTPTTEGYWKSVADVPSLGPGDIIAWLTMPGSKSTNTGMVMVMVDGEEGPRPWT